MTYNPEPAGDELADYWFNREGPDEPPDLGGDEPDDEV